jgi:hypothetical protein
MILYTSRSGIRRALHAGRSESYQPPSVHDVMDIMNEYEDEDSKNRNRQHIVSLMMPEIIHYTYDRPNAIRGDYSLKTAISNDKKMLELERFNREIKHLISIENIPSLIKTANKLQKFVEINARYLYTRQIQRSVDILNMAFEKFNVRKDGTSLSRGSFVNGMENIGEVIDELEMAIQDDAM